MRKQYHRVPSNATVSSYKEPHINPSGSGILFSGILSWFGLREQHQEEDDPITSTVKSAILCIQVLH